MSVVNINVSGDNQEARYLTLRLTGLLQAAGFPCNAGRTGIDVIVTSEKSRASVEPVNSLDAQILAELQAIRKAVTPIDTVVAVTMARQDHTPAHGPDTTLGKIRKLAHMVRQDGPTLRHDTTTLARELEAETAMEKHWMQSRLQGLVQALIEGCRQGQNTASLFDVATMVLGATGGAYRG